MQLPGTSIRLNMMGFFREMFGAADQGETRAEMQEENSSDKTRPHCIDTYIWTHDILKSHHQSGTSIQISKYDHSSQQSATVWILIGGQVRFPISTDKIHHFHIVRSPSGSSCAIQLSLSVSQTSMSGKQTGLTGIIWSTSKSLSLIYSYRHSEYEVELDRGSVFGLSVISSLIL